MPGVAFLSSSFSSTPFGVCCRRACPTLRPCVSISWALAVGATDAPDVPVGACADGFAVANSANPVAAMRYLIVFSRSDDPTAIRCNSMTTVTRLAGFSPRLLTWPGWGFGHATLNGRPLYDDYETHFMITQGIRDRKTLPVKLPAGEQEAARRPF